MKHPLSALPGHAQLGYQRAVWDGVANESVLGPVIAVTLETFSGKILDFDLPRRVDLGVRITGGHGRFDRLVLVWHPSAAGHGSVRMAPGNSAQEAP